jgi:hypothetical protein
MMLKLKHLGGALRQEAQQERARVAAAERAAIAAIPSALRDWLTEANAKLAARGGCPGCKSTLVGVHHGDCPELRRPDAY